MDKTTTHQDEVRTDDLLRTGDDQDVRTANGTGYAVAGHAGNEDVTTVAAVFLDHERAHDAVHQLHGDGFRDTWIGRTKYDENARYDGATVPSTATAGDGEVLVGRTYVTAPVYGETPAVYGDAASGAETRVESDNWFMRLFGEGDESLHDALVRHGVSETDAGRAGSLPPHSAIVTVDGANHPELAAQILSEAGGRVITSGLGQAGYGTMGRYADNAGRAAELRAAPRGLETSDDSDPDIALDAVPERTPTATSYDDYGKYRAGMPIDESTRLQLRAERLRVDKTRISRGEATVGPDGITETDDVDMPFVREEFFVERRPAGSTGRSDMDENAPTGSGDAGRILPMSRAALRNDA